MTNETATGFDPERITTLLEAGDEKFLQPIVRKAAESFYDQVLGSIQDYLMDNLDFNLKSHISYLQHENQRMRDELSEIDKALGYWTVGVNGRAESIAQLQAQAARSLPPSAPASPLVGTVNAASGSMEANHGFSATGIEVSGRAESDQL